MQEPAKVTAWQDQAESRHGQRLTGCAHQRERAVQFQQAQVGVDVVLRGDCIENEIEAVGLLLHRGGVLGDHDLMRAEAQAVQQLCRARWRTGPRAPQRRVRISPPCAQGRRGQPMPTF